MFNLECAHTRFLEIGWVLRQVLLDIRAENSNLAKSLGEKVTTPCTKMKTHTNAYYPCKINKTNHFSPILVTSIHKTGSF